MYLKSQKGRTDQIQEQSAHMSFYSIIDITIIIVITETEVESMFCTFMV